MLGCFNIGEVKGSGTFAVVAAATDRRTGERCALKQLTSRACPRASGTAADDEAYEYMVGRMLSAGRGHPRRVRL